MRSSFTGGRPARGGPNTPIPDPLFDPRPPSEGPDLGGRCENLCLKTRHFQPLVAVGGEGTGGPPPPTGGASSVAGALLSSRLTPLGGPRRKKQQMHQN